MMSSATERGLLLNGLLATIRLSLMPMVVTDPHQADNPIIAANKPFITLVQYAEDELVGRNCRFLQGKRTDRAAVQAVGASLRRGTGFVQFLVNYRKDGSEFYNLLFISPVHDHAGDVQFFFASQHDLSGDPPIDIAEFPLGPAHMPPAQESEFRLLLLDIAHEVALANAAELLPSRVRALEGAVAAAREIGRLATRLKPGATTA